MLSELDPRDLAQQTDDLAGEERWLATPDGAKLVVHTVGPADGPTVVLAHCWTGSQQTWAPVTRRLVESGCRVVRWDQRGHGRSSAGDLGHTLEGLAGDLATVLRELDIRDAVLAGHSMGGFTVQGLAVHHRELLDERARAMVLVATASHGLRRSPLTVRPGWFAHPLVQSVMERPVGSVFVRGTFGRAAHPHHTDVTRADFAATPGPVRAAFVEAFLGMDNRAGLADVPHPTTVLAGRLDTLTPLALNRALAEAIPNAELRVFDRLGHMLPFEAPDDVAAAILEHVAR
jgi:pimeloyl-ACP methyl ester carboxylesterase